MSAERFVTVEHVVPTQHIRNYARSTSSSQEAVLQLVVKQYIPLYNSKPRPGDVTILACHANGCAKELYEPLWDELFDYSVKNEGFRIRSIWIADVAHQGASGVLNEHLLGNEMSWSDLTRDYLGMVNHFRAEMPRPIMGFGHSIGGNVIVNLALMHPRLFTSIITVEPTLNETPVTMNFMGSYIATFKKDRWASLAEARGFFERHPLYKRWDRRAFEKMLQYSLRFASRPSNSIIPPDQSGPVTLTTLRDQEAIGFGRQAYPDSPDAPGRYKRSAKTHPDLDPRQGSLPFYRAEATMTFRNLPHLHPSCCYIYGTFSNMGGAKPPERKVKLDITGTGIGGSGGAAVGRVREHLLKGSHFVPFEDPALVANHTGSWIQEQMKIWAEDEEEEESSWKNVPMEDRKRVDDEWKYWINRTYGKKEMGQKGKGSRL